MPLAEKILPHYTYEDYVQWEGKWELIEGFPIAMSPFPSPKHQWVNANLVSELRTSLKKVDCKHCKVYLPVDYKIAEDTILQPDLMIVCDEITKKYLDRPPVLVMEILSPFTSLRDRYEKQGVKYYLMVNTDKEEVEIFEHDGEGYRQIPFDPQTPFGLALPDDCHIQIVLKEIWT